MASWTCARSEEEANLSQAYRMGRKPAGEKKLSNAEKQKRYREKNKEILKEKDS